MTRSDGGGIDGGGAITDTLVARNRARRGGGIFAPASLTRSIVRRNAARDVGGGIYALSSLELIDSRVVRNTAGTHGGGVFAFDSATVSLDATSSVTGNDPDDCVGTPAC